MKAYVKAGIKGFCGKLDGAIYCYHPRLKRTLMRSAPQMPIQPQNLPCRSVKAAVEDNLLPQIPGYQYLDREIRAGIRLTLS